MALPEKIRLGDILLEQKILSRDQLEFCLIEQKRSGRKLGQVFVDNGFVTEEDICHALTKQLKIPFINLKTFQLNPVALRMLPEMRARRYRAIVLEDRRDSVLVGMADPTDLFVYDELYRLFRKNIELAVVTEESLFQAINRHYRKTSEITEAARELGQEMNDSVVGFGEGAATTSIEDAPVVRLLQKIFEDATQVQASDIHIEPQEKTLHIRFRIDGIMNFQTEADIKIAAPLALRLKIHGESGYFGKAFAAGWPLCNEGRPAKSRRSPLDHAYAIRRIGRHAAAQSIEGHAASAGARHSACHAGKIP